MMHVKDLHAGFYRQELSGALQNTTILKYQSADFWNAERVKTRFANAFEAAVAKVAPSCWRFERGWLGSRSWVLWRGFWSKCNIGGSSC